MTLRRSHPTGGPERARRTDGDRGATVVELAIVSLFLLILIAGAFDYGQAWRASLAVNEASRTGARVGSAQGTNRGADFYALSGVKAALVSSGKIGQVERLVIFKSTSANGAVPPTCKTSSTSDCQVITGADFRTNWETLSVTAATDATGCLNIATAKNWCPTTRENTQAVAEYYGVWVQIRHTFDFRITGTSQTIERTSTMRLEPKVQ